MKNKMSKIFAMIQLILALGIIGALRIWAPVCDKMMTLENGKNVHMKCFYTDRAAMMIAIILIVCALVLLFSKKDVRAIQIVSFVSALMLFFAFGKTMGVCMNHQMPCNLTALWAKGLGGASMVLSILDLVLRKEGQLLS